MTDQISTSDGPAPTCVIVGGGIVGLTLALGLKEHVGITPHIYEAADAFADDVGAGMGLYTNGLKVLRFVNPSLFQSVKDFGHPFATRRWERHDGTEVAVADETVLSRDHDEDMLQTIGIRRWRLQKVLADYAIEAGIPIHFGKRLKSVCMTPDKMAEVIFEDGERLKTHILFGCDGSKSQVRQSVAQCGAKLEYTGVTCLMGISETPCQIQAISLPSSLTTRCHGAFFPVGKGEQCFQFHFPIDEKDADTGNWGTLSPEGAKEHCDNLIGQLQEEGWHDKYIEPLFEVSNAVRIGFCLLDKPLRNYAYGEGRQVVLAGDAAHPPVPYLGQGAQQGLEDVGVIINLLKQLCMEENGNGREFGMTNFKDAMKIYEKMRMPRAQEITERSKTWGEVQQKRASNERYNTVKEELIRRDVFFKETLSTLFAGATYSVNEDVARVLESEAAVLLPLIQEE